MREHIERLPEINKTGDEIRDDTETSEYPDNLKKRYSSWCCQACSALDALPSSLPDDLLAKLLPKLLDVKGRFGIQKDPEATPNQWAPHFETQRLGIKSVCRMLEEAST